MFWAILLHVFGVQLYVGSTYTPQCTSIKGLMVSSRWYLGCLRGYLGGAGRLGLEANRKLQADAPRARLRCGPQGASWGFGETADGMFWYVMIWYDMVWYGMV